MNPWNLRPNSFACPDLLRSASRSMAGRCAGWVAGIKPGSFSSSWFFATEGPSDGRICTSAVCHDCIPLHVADEAAARAGADHALGYEPVSERFVMVSVSLIGEADASFARFAPENAGSVWECAGSALITCPPYVCQMSRPRLFGAF